MASECKVMCTWEMKIVYRYTLYSAKLSVNSGKGIYYHVRHLSVDFSSMWSFRLKKSKENGEVTRGIGDKSNAMGSPVLIAIAGAYQWLLKLQNQKGCWKSWGNKILGKDWSHMEQVGWFAWGRRGSHLSRVKRAWQLWGNWVLQNSYQLLGGKCYGFKGCSLPFYTPWIHHS